MAAVAAAAAAVVAVEESRNKSDRRLFGAIELGVVIGTVQLPRHLLMHRISRWRASGYSAPYCLSLVESSDVFTQLSVEMEVARATVVICCTT